MVRVVLLEVCGSQEVHHGLGWTSGENNIVLYADDGRILGRNPIWVQTDLTSVVGMFEIVGLQKKLGNTKATVCTTGFIWGKQGVAAYKQRATGEGETSRKQKKTRVSYDECRTMMEALLLHHHMECAHGKVMPHTQGWMSEEDNRRYMVSFPRVMKSVDCPVYGCPERAHIPGRLRDNFMYRNWKSNIVILQEGLAPIPRCAHCGIHMSEARLRRH